MPKLRATNDYLVDRLVADPNYRIDEDGSIWTTMQRNGRNKPGVWRRAGRVDKEGYRELSYGSRFLKEHRVVYRKFNGPLNERLVVDHKDRNRANNRPDNLQLISQAHNVFYRDRRREDAACQATPGEIPRAA